MGSLNWEDLVGAVVDGRFRLRTLTYAGQDQAEFNAEDLAERHAAAVTVIAVAPGEADRVRSELEAAARLQHPRLLRILGTGSIDGLPYLASEPPAATLAERLRDRPLSEAEARPLLAEIIDGLRFLHAQGLAYRNLRPETIVRTGDGWKLADYGSVHAIGAADASLPLDGSQYLPPEAYEGRVTAAWDAWSLGALIREALTGTSDPVMLPEPFDRICRECRGSDPRARMTVEQIAEELALKRQETPAKPAVAPAAAAPAEAVAATAQAEARAGTLKRTPLTVAALVLVVIASVWLARRGTETPPPPAPAPKPAPVAAVEKPTLPRPTPMPPAPPPAAKKAVQTGRADFAAADMNGRRTASGERFDNRGLTAAHPKYPLGTRLRVTNTRNGRSVVVRVNDRGVFRRGYVIRLTQRAALDLGFARSGSAPVTLEVVN